jgi:hypothetical protein
MMMMAFGAALGQTSRNTSTLATQYDGVVDQAHQTYLFLGDEEGVLLPPADFHFEALGIPTDFTFMVWILPSNGSWGTQNLFEIPSKGGIYCHIIQDVLQCGQT